MSGGGILNPCARMGQPRHVLAARVTQRIAQSPGSSRLLATAASHSGGQSPAPGKTVSCSKPLRGFEIFSFIQGESHPLRLCWRRLAQNPGWRPPWNPSIVHSLPLSCWLPSTSGKFLPNTSARCASAWRACSKPARMPPQTSSGASATCQRCRPALRPPTLPDDRRGPHETSATAHRLLRA
ncbi:hypothetical protein ACCUM_2366 [Candidatus Accumulibacter phosphatis]|uniref:Uncharacterized protein n=1 Tax=Candidatus Accumulibacter phosphatis TaxID=327160 RepID=A0A5S4ERC4_9PROT|nr:hypothetical protein ACCUM_2366 [Candidatus Accumulibacter phosphatis]